MDVTMAEPGEILPERKIDYSVYDHLQTSKSSIESIIAKMLSIKKDGLSKSQLGELVTQMSLHFVSLRQVSLSHPLSHISLSLEKLGNLWLILYIRLR